ncbi:MAG: undecaprenyl-diphosphate phosphatase [bacterium]|nr:undecaprenyl-diphosphate phosphatase [bacterium]
MILLFQALVMGIVEGLTEFLPISSTGHLIIAGNLLKFLPKEQRDLFEIFIQLGAVLAVCWEYRRKLRTVATGLSGDARARRFAINVAVAFVPAGVLALALGDTIKAHLFAPVPVAVAFIAGGLMIFWAERRRHTVSVADVEAMTWRDALKVGLAQCFALVPGTSRSGATIIGGLFCGLSRQAATEFSFFLAIPTLGAASLYDLFDHRKLLDADLAGLLAVGFAASFVCALFAVRALLRYVSRHDFTPFAWYRLAFGAVVLLTAYLGVVDWRA